MAFESRVFSLAKDAEHPDENQDACRIDPARAVAVIADGVATGIFSRRWAEILAAATLAGSRCEGCHLDLSAAEVDIVKDSVAKGGLADCPQCGRLLAV